MLDMAANRFFATFLLKLYNERKAAEKDRSAGEVPADVFQLLIEAVEEGESADKPAKQAVEGGEEDADIIHKELGDSNSALSESKKRMSKVELLAQSFLLLIAGYETTGSTLHFMFNALACHPEIQELLREEILSVTGEEGEITHEHTTQMLYLNAVLQETLRMFPPAPRMNRECNEPLTLRGIRFEEDDTIGVPIYAIHYDPQYYPEPEKFDPERFTPEARASRDPLTYLPFGYGPRNCIGMRLAEFEIRVVTATLLRKYRFAHAEKSPVRK